ncbi:hypothetical protein AGLY_005958 [Aphis glycines]|uniref:Pre-C2HC domain-containing protein n=1 Tax=Aphis glycines TaxID=307491 RepID=A0A6G0TUP6_APHGL|nr:hypothetical protein AGLY_005958 [Aphis glycines]
MSNKNGQKSGLASPSTPKSTKRNLSSSSLSPLLNDKNPKKFVSTNRFAVLASEEDNLIEPDVMGNASNAIEESIIPTQHDNSRAPPFYVQDIKNVFAFKNTLIQLTGQNGFTCKSLPSFLIVHPQGRENFSTIAKHLMETDACFHTFMPSIYRPYKIVIRNLHHSTLISDISDALDELGHFISCVINISKNGHPLPLFFVDLKRNTNNKEVLSLSSILHTKIKVELPYRTKSGPPQCKNCQSYGHTAKYCHRPPRCIKCGKGHFSDTCTKDKSSLATCALCSGDHTSNYKGCPKYKALLKHRKVTPLVRRNPNTVLTSNILKPSPLPPKASYASVANPNNNPLLNNSTNDYIFSKFISDLSSLINPLISLLTAVLQKQSIP